MVIKPILFHLFKSFQSHGTKVCNTRKWYTDYKVPLTNITGRLNPDKVSQMCTYYPSSVKDCSWGIIKHYKVGYLALLKTQYKLTMLQWEDDPEFDIESFKKGTKQVRIQNDRLRLLKHILSYLIRFI